MGIDVETDLAIVALAATVRGLVEENRRLRHLLGIVVHHVKRDPAIKGEALRELDDACQSAGVR